MSRTSRSRGSSPLILVRGLAAVSLAAALVGCSAAMPSANPASAGTPASAPATTSASTPTPMPSPTATPGPLDVAWSRSADPATPTAGDWQSMEQPTWTRLGDTFVMAVGTQGDESGPRIWLSEDALHWRAVTVDPASDQSVSVQAVTTGGPGLVAIGEVAGSTDDVPSRTLWTSPDGVSWTRSADTGLTDGQLWLLDATARDAVVYDEAGAQVTAYAGPAWTGGDPLTIVDTAGVLTAFVGDTPGQPIGVWASGGASGWTQVATMPGADGGNVLRAAHGPAGWVAFGCDADCSSLVSWTSTDGVTWLVTPDAPMDEVTAIVADQAGFVAVGQRITGLGCAVGEGEIFGETWTSSAGRTWRQMPDQPEFDRASIHTLLVSGRTLFGLGATWPADGAPTSTAWSYDLPDASSDDGLSPTPAPVATPSPSGEGCGG